MSERIKNAFKKVKTEINELNRTLKKQEKDKKLIRAEINEIKNIIIEDLRLELDKKLDEHIDATLTIIKEKIKTSNTVFANTQKQKLDSMSKAIDKSLERFDVAFEKMQNKIDRRISIIENRIDIKFQKLEKSVEKGISSLSRPLQKAIGKNTYSNTEKRLFKRMEKLEKKIAKSSTKQIKNKSHKAQKGIFSKFVDFLADE